MPTTATNSNNVYLPFNGYTVRIEYNKDFAILHLPAVTGKFNKGMFTDMKNRLDEWSRFFQTTGYNGLYAAAYPTDGKVVRLLNRLGFMYQATAQEGYLVFRKGFY